MIQHRRRHRRRRRRRHRPPPPPLLLDHFSRQSCCRQLSEWRKWEQDEEQVQVSIRRRRREPHSDAFVSASSRLRPASTSIGSMASPIPTLAPVPQMPLVETNTLVKCPVVFERHIPTRPRVPAVQFEGSSHFLARQYIHFDLVLRRSLRRSVHLHAPSYPSLAICKSLPSRFLHLYLQRGRKCSPVSSYYSDEAHGVAFDFHHHHHLLVRHLLQLASVVMHPRSHCLNMHTCHCPSALVDVASKYV